MTRVWSVYKVVNDHDSKHDYWAIAYGAQVAAQPSNYLVDVHFPAKPTGAKQTYFALPKPGAAFNASCGDTKTNTVSGGVGVGPLAFQLSLSSTYTACDHYYPFTDGEGAFHIHWTGAQKGQIELNFVLAVTVAQGKSATWDLGHWTATACFPDPLVPC